MAVTGGVRGRPAIKRPLLTPQFGSYRPRSAPLFKELPGQR